MSNIIEQGYVLDEDFYLIECEQCGNNFKTDNESNSLCSKRCYLDAKAEFYE